MLYSNGYVTTWFKGHFKRKFVRTPNTFVHVDTSDWLNATLQQEYQKENSCCLTQGYIICVRYIQYNTWYQAPATRRTSEYVRNPPDDGLTHMGSVRTRRYQYLVQMLTTMLHGLYSTWNPGTRATLYEYSLISTRTNWYQYTYNLRVR